MAKEKKEPGFKDRNKILKTLKATGKFGWMHLIVAENNLTKNRFLRLKKYLNWYSVKNPTELRVILDLLSHGTKELGWTMEAVSDSKIVEEGATQLSKKQKPTSVISKTLDFDIPEEIVDFFEENPEVVEKFISLKMQGYDFDYIFDLLRVIDKAILGSSERVRTAFKEVVEKISSEDAKSMQELSDLMGKYNLFQITSVTNLVKYRLDTINNLETMIHDERTYEIKTDNSIHRLLEKNMWLIDEQYWIAQSNKSLRNFIGAEIEKTHSDFKNKRPDFACVDFENKLIILELKRPSIELRKDALDQAEMYLRVIKKYKTESYKNINVIVLGNKISSEAYEIVDLRKGVEIKTYEDFLSKTRKRYKSYLDAVENVKNEKESTGKAYYKRK
jgi:hypothetical protein